MFTMSRVWDKEKKFESPTGIEPMTSLPPGVWEDMGSIHVRDSDSFSLSHARDTMNTTSLLKKIIVS